MLKRLKRMYLLIGCLTKALLRGAANQIPTNISAIIVVPTGKLGDVICATPVLYAIRKHLPRTRIIVVGNSKLHRPLLSDSSLVDEYLDLGERGLARRIRKYQAEVALVTGPSFEPTAILYLAGIPLVVAPKVEGGFSPAETKPYKILQWFIKTYPYHIDGYAPRERLKALKPLGIFVDDTTKHLGFSKHADKKVKQFLINNGIDIGRDFVAGISPTAGSKIKEWPEERFAEVADYLMTRYGTKIIIIGSSDDKIKVEKTKSYIKSQTKVLEVTDFNIDELKALIAKCGLFISVDTGPIYIAEAFDVPTIDIVGPVDERIQPPRGFIHRNVVPPNRIRAEVFILDAQSYNREEAMRQVRSISVHAVLKEIDALIHDLHRNK